MANNNADSLTSPKAPAISEGDMESRLPYASSVSPNESSNLLGPNIKLLQQDQRNVKRLKVILIVLLVIALVSGNTQCRPWSKPGHHLALGPTLIQRLSNMTLCSLF